MTKFNRNCCFFSYLKILQILSKIQKKKKIFSSTRELQVLSEVGVIFLEVFTIVGVGYNFLSFKEWGKFVMIEFK